MEIRGTAHPPPPRDGGRLDPSDLTRAEIATTDVAGRPLLYEHDQGARIGTCLASWEGRDGSLRIAANVTDPGTQAQIQSGRLRGLSLGTEMVQDTEGALVFKRQGEVSVCEEGRRAHTWIDTVGGKMVQVAACASKNSARCARRPPAARASPAHNAHARAEEADKAFAPASFRACTRARSPQTATR